MITIHYPRRIINRVARATNKVKYSIHYLILEGFIDVEVLVYKQERMTVSVTVSPKCPLKIDVDKIDKTKLKVVDTDNGNNFMFIDLTSKTSCIYCKWRYQDQ